MLELPAVRSDARSGFLRSRHRNAEDFQVDRAERRAGGEEQGRSRRMPHCVGTTWTETSMRSKASVGPDHAPEIGEAFDCSRATATETCSLPASLLLVG